MRRRKLAWLVVTAVLMFGGAISNYSRAEEQPAGKKWANLVGFEDCYYSCGSNTGHSKCTC